VRRLARKFGVEGLTFRQEGQPPIPAGLAVGFTSANEVAFTHHPDDGLLLINDRDGADRLLKQKLRHFPRRGVGKH